MLSRFGLIRCWAISVLVFTIRDTVAGDIVVEINEKDLIDQGFNVNPSEQDLFLPVVNPLKTPLRYSKTTMRPTQTHKALPSSGHNVHNLKFPNGFLKFAKSSPKHVNVSSNKTSKQNPKIILKRNNSKSTPQIRKESNGKQNIPIDYNRDIFRIKKLHQREVYYNIYDVDKPVIIKKRKNQQGRVVEDEQEVLNNTLALYGLRLDPKGETVILKSMEESPLEENKQEMENTKKKNHKTVDKMEKETKLKSGKNYNKDSRKKNHTQDVIKSVWDVFKNVSQTWK